MAYTSSNSTNAQLVIVDWNDLTNPETSESLKATIFQAYGSSGLGVLGIRNVPNFRHLKSKLLPMARQLSQLDGNELEKLTDAKSLYNAGWSHGKEKIRDTPDTAKASYYYNPISELPGTPELRERYSLSYPTNVWPDDSLIPGFRETARSLGKLLTNVCQQVALQLDAMIEDCDLSCLKNTDKVKARLLYYYPTSEKTQDSWIGWHNDSGFLTALSGDIYWDGDSIVEAPPDAGLFVDQGHQPVRIQIPADCCAVQLGECTQIITNSSVSATPHCVQGCQYSRATLACFVDAPPDFQLLGKVLEESSDKVPKLRDRWTNGMTFGDFLNTTFKKYYEWSTS